MTLDSDESDGVEMHQEKIRPKSHPTNSNESNNTMEDNQYCNKSAQREKKSSEQTSEGQSESLDQDEGKMEKCLNVQENEKQASARIFHGLLFIEQLKNTKLILQNSSCDYFVTYEGFWNESTAKTNISSKSISPFLDCYLDHLNVSMVH